MRHRGHDRLDTRVSGHTAFVRFAGVGVALVLGVAGCSDDDAAAGAPTNTENPEPGETTADPSPTSTEGATDEPAEASPPAQSPTPDGPVTDAAYADGQGDATLLSDGQPDPDADFADLASVSVQGGAQAIVTYEFAAATPEDVGVTVGFKAKDPETGQLWTVSASLQGATGVSMTGSKFESQSGGAHQHAGNCAGTGTHDAAAGRVELSFPSSCYGLPDLAHVQWSSSVFERAAGGSYWNDTVGSLTDAPHVVRFAG